MGKVAKEGGESATGAPVFLRKTYDMINTCDNSIASWFDNGSTFVVKDTERFAAEIIPEYFKHNNFSSFVRQLNFYGFRKIKSDPLRLKDAKSSEETRYWKFRHEKFRQGRPDLLYQIRKNNADSSVDKQDVDTLKAEVKDLRSKLAVTMKEVADLKALVAASLYSSDRSVTVAPPAYLPPVATKKRRVDEEGSAITTKASSNSTETDSNLPPPLTVSNQSALVPRVPPPVPPQSAFSTRNDSHSSLDDDMSVFLNLMADDAAIPDTAFSLGIPYDDVETFPIPPTDTSADLDASGSLKESLDTDGPEYS